MPKRIVTKVYSLNKSVENNNKMDWILIKKCITFGKKKVSELIKANTTIGEQR